MSLWHRHQWVEQMRTFAPPRAAEVSRISEEALERLAFGVTSVEHRCLVCNKLKVVEILGDARHHDDDE